MMTTTYENPWKYEGKDFESTDIDSSYGFVYQITSPEGKKYIGKKFFWKSKILPKTKTRKRRQRTLVESDWKSYYGSSDLLAADIETIGKDKFTRVILRLCATKGECSYYETKEQLLTDALLSEDYYNSYVGCKIHRKHLK